MENQPSRYIRHSCSYNFILAAVIGLAFFGGLIQTVITTTTSVAAGSGILQQAVIDSLAGDILNVAAGDSAISTSLSNSRVEIDKAIEIRGAQYGVDARGRSTVGYGDLSYSGANDPAESTVIGCETCEGVIYIVSSNVVIDGFTITSIYTGNTNLNYAI